MSEPLIGRFPRSLACGLEAPRYGKGCSTGLRQRPRRSLAWTRDYARRGPSLTRTTSRSKRRISPESLHREACAPTSAPPGALSGRPMAGRLRPAIGRASHDLRRDGEPGQPSERRLRVRCDAMAELGAVDPGALECARDGAGGGAEDAEQDVARSDAAVAAAVGDLDCAREGELGPTCPTWGHGADRGRKVEVVQPNPNRCQFPSNSASRASRTWS
jgi:hypothetical protein